MFLKYSTTRRQDQPCAADCCIVFYSCTLRTFAIKRVVMPANEHAAELYRHLKVRNVKPSKGTIFDLTRFRLTDR